MGNIFELLMDESTCSSAIVETVLQGGSVLAKI